MIVPAVTVALSPADVLADRVFGPALGALELFGVYLGTQLGVCEVLAERGPQTTGGLARMAGIAARFARARGVDVLPVDNDLLRVYRLHPLAHAFLPTQPLPHPKEHHRRTFLRSPAHAGEPGAPSWRPPFPPSWPRWRCPRARTPV